MRNIVVCVVFLVCGLCSSVVNAKQETVTTNNGTVVAEQNTLGLPKDFADFFNRHQAIKSPEEAIKIYFDAIFCYIDPQTRDEAKKMLAYIMRAREHWYQSRKYFTLVSRMEDPQAVHIFRSYAVGSSPQNGYEMSPNHYNLQIAGKTGDSNHAQLELISSGNNSKRTVELSQIDGLWYVTEAIEIPSWVRMPTN